MEKIILPSVLSADFYNLGKDINDVKRAGAKYLHIDVMDGDFVPNFSIGIPVIKSIKKHCDMVLDGHLMIKNPGAYIDAFADTGLDYITIHYEASKNVREDMEKIRKRGIKAGLSIKPDTGVDVLYPYIDEDLVDMILIMSVEPGFGGQSFILSSLDKVRELKSYLVKNKKDIPIEIDGGVDISNIKKISDMGVDMIVAGSAVFNENSYESYRRLYSQIQ